MSDLLVQLAGVSKSYAGDEQRRVLDGLDLDLSPGERISVIGPSGSGKSTLLNLLGTLDTPTEGEVRFLGDPSSGRSEAELARLRSEKIGFICQLHHLLPQCSVLENVLIPTLALEERPADATQRAEQLLERIGLAELRHKSPGQLSGGERQRVAVVRSLINRPQLLLADEPTGALDEANAANLLELLLEIAEAETVAMVLVTHDREQAGRMETVYELRSGKLHLPTA